MTLFHFYLDVAISNSFVLYCLARGEHKVADITDGKYHFKGLLEFKASLVDQLLERAAVHIPPHRAVMSALRSLSPVDDVGGSSFAHHSPGVHLPTFETVRCDDGTSRAVQRTCAYARCPSRTGGHSGTSRTARISTKCDACHVHLCILETRNCFKMYHEEMLRSPRTPGDGGGGGSGAPSARAV